VGSLELPGFHELERPRLLLDPSVSGVALPPGHFARHDDSPRIADWRAHFYSVRRWFFSANILLILHTAVTISLVRIDASLLPVLVAQSLLLIINIVGVLNAHPKVHIAIVFAALAIQIFGFGTVFFAFGSPVSG